MWNQLACFRYMLQNSLSLSHPQKKPCLSVISLKSLKRKSAFPTFLWICKSWMMEKMGRKWEREKKTPKKTRLRLDSWSLSLSVSPALIFSLHPVSPPCLALRMTSSWTSRMFSSGPNGARSSPGVRWVKSKCGLCYTDQNKATRCMRFPLFVLWPPSVKAVNFKRLSCSCKKTNFPTAWCCHHVFTYCSEWCSLLFFHHRLIFVYTSSILVSSDQNAFIYGFGVNCTGGFIWLIFTNLPSLQICGECG